MPSVIALLDKASKVCGGDAALARRLGKQRNQVYLWRSGRDAISPETVAMLCDVAHVDDDEARRWLARSIVDNPKNAGISDMLERVFFTLAAIGAALLLSLAPNGAQAISNGSGSTPIDKTIHCRGLVTCLRRWLLRARSVAVALPTKARAVDLLEMIAAHLATARFWSGSLGRPSQAKDHERSGLVVAARHARQCRTVP